MRRPDRETDHARAWRMPVPDGSLGPAVARWLVDMPGAHAFWHYWQLFIMHLRPVTGMPPARKAFPTATHEVIFIAVNPERCPEPDPDATRVLPFLEPLDLVEQVTVLSDRQAEQLLERVLSPILEGRASPDQDCRRFWRDFIARVAAAQRTES